MNNDRSLLGEKELKWFKDPNKASRELLLHQGKHD